VVSHLAQRSQVSFQANFIVAMAIFFRLEFCLEEFHFFEEGLLMSFDDCAIESQ
jgi:hypothetical protein